MVEWLSQNAAVISALANVAMLAVWFFYAQLLYSGFRRERRARVLINKGVSYADLDAPCLICNMSKEPIFIQGIFVDLETSDGTYSALATDTDEGEVEQAKARAGERTRQGPLDTGSCLEIHSFRELIQRAAKIADIPLENGRPTDPDLTLKSLTITLISIYGPEDNPFGAARKFNLDCDEPGRVKITPESVDTDRLTSRKGKKRARELLQVAATSR